MTKKTDISVEQTLRFLYDLQLIDSRIDQLRSMRGELPLEVKDLEDDIEGLTIRLSKIKAEQDALKEQTKQNKTLIEEAKTLIKKYNEQQKSVRNNREYNSINKEVEYQELEIQLAEKHIKEWKVQLEHKKEVLAETDALIKTKQEHLETKKGELGSILAETQKEEDYLADYAQRLSEELEERLLKAYIKIRNSVANKLAVVPVERGASGGSFFTIPPQVQMEIATRKKIITDEHSGRILVDNALAEEEKEKMRKIFDEAQEGK